MPVRAREIVRSHGRLSRAARPGQHGHQHHYPTSQHIASPQCGLRSRSWETTGLRTGGERGGQARRWSAVERCGAPAQRQGGLKTCMRALTRDWGHPPVCCPRRGPGLYQPGSARLVEMLLHRRAGLLEHRGVATGLGPAGRVFTATLEQPAITYPRAAPLVSFIFVLRIANGTSLRGLPRLRVDFWPQSHRRPERRARRRAYSPPTSRPTRVTSHTRAYGCTRYMFAGDLFVNVE